MAICPQSVAIKALLNEEFITKRVVNPMVFMSRFFTLPKLASISCSTLKKRNDPKTTWVL